LRDRVHRASQFDAQRGAVGQLVGAGALFELLCAARTRPGADALARLLLEAAPAVAPAPDEPFLIVDDSLAVCAVSRQAERLLGVAETEVVHRHVTAFVVPADHRAAPPFNVVSLVGRAARGAAEPRPVVVRPADTFGVRWWARVASCEAPTAALLVITGPA
jgi:PAS domain-containing protein